jgi:opacity protein-like surface antigen
MVRRFAILSAGIWTLLMVMAGPASAQVEASINVGYTLSEGIAVDQREYLGVFYDRAEVNSGGSVTATIGGYLSPRLMLEFQYSHQASKLTAEGNAGKLTISDLGVDTYHGVFVYHFASSDVAKAVPFVFIGAGATYYGFGDVQVAGAPANIKIDGNTQFSTTWGAGVKVYFNENVGAKFTARWTPTYIKSDAEGYWCDPFYGCWVLGDPDYSHQFDLSGGLTFKF